MEVRRKKNEKSVKQLKKAVQKVLIVLLLLVPAVFVVMPVLILLSGALMDSQELRNHLGSVFSQGNEFISWKLIPDYPSFANYKKILLETPQFFILFWNSMKLVVCILAGQLVMAVPAAWGFAVYQIKGSRVLFVLYVVLMLLPFQVTMLSCYLFNTR